MPELDRMVAGLRCRDVLALLGEYVDGALETEVVRQVDRHLQGCNACEKFGGEYASLVTTLRQALTTRPPETGLLVRLTDHMEKTWAEERT